MTKRNEFGFGRSWSVTREQRGVQQGTPDIAGLDIFSTAYMPGEFEFLQRKDASKFRDWMFARGISHEPFYLMPFTKDIQYPDNITFDFQSAAAYNRVLTYPVGLDGSFEFKYKDQENGGSLSTKFNNGYGALLGIYNEKTGYTALAHVIEASTETINSVLHNVLNVYLLYDPRVFSTSVPQTWYQQDLTISLLLFGSFLEVSEEFVPEFSLTNFRITFEELDEYPVLFTTSNPGSNFTSDTDLLRKDRFPGLYSPVTDPGVGSVSDYLAPGRDESTISTPGLNVTRNKAPGRDDSAIVTSGLSVLFNLAPGRDDSELTTVGLSVTNDLAPGEDEALVDPGFDASLIEWLAGAVASLQEAAALGEIDFKAGATGDNLTTYESISSVLHLAPGYVHSQVGNPPSGCAVEIVAFPAPGNGVVLFDNVETPYTATCVDDVGANYQGDDVTVTIAAGTYQATSQALADSLAQQAAQTQAIAGLACVLVYPNQPDTISGLELWLKAEDFEGILDNGDDVGETSTAGEFWEDQSGEGNDATGLSTTHIAPTWESASFGDNLVPAIRFSGGESSSALSALLLATAIDVGDGTVGTIIIVAQKIETDDQAAWMGTNNVPQSSSVDFNDVSDNKLRWNPATGSTRSSDAVTDFTHTDPLMFCWRKNASGEIEFRVNKTDYTPASPETAAGLTSMALIGNSPQVNVRCDSRIQEVAVYPETYVTDEELDDMFDNYINAKCGLE